MGMSEWYGPTNDEESIATIHTALNIGLNFLIPPMFTAMVIMKY